MMSGAGTWKDWWRLLIWRFVTFLVTVDAVVGQGGKMAICSASTKDACLFVLDSLLGKDNLEKFDLILAGDDVPRRKPDPMIYKLASEKLGVPPER